MKQKACNICEFCRDTLQKIDKFGDVALPVLRCHINPPSPVGEKWPRVEKGDFCGVFARKDQERKCNLCHFGKMSAKMLGKNEERDVHECRFHPPSLGEEKWPEIDGTDFCGAFQARL